MITLFEDNKTFFYVTAIEYRLKVSRTSIMPKLTMVKWKQTIESWRQWDSLSKATVLHAQLTVEDKTACSKVAHKSFLLYSTGIR